MKFSGLLETGDGRMINIDNVNSITPHTSEGRIISYRVTFTNNTTEEIDNDAFAALKEFALNNK
ncbi:hypothetical protein ACQW5G_02960 [Fructilactobacillus sp. Tb1]|uniref:hypothetical protein n=1 Tax=Fructilactobacillus sp. Tb1 TaxID=3422304 RepID=UPI003D2DDB39